MEPQSQSHTHLTVAIIGAGMSGLYMAKRLQGLGIDFTIYEKADEVGGTWRDNIYPGLYVDIPVSMYQLDWAPKFDWSHAYAPGGEIQEYLLSVAHDHDLRQHVVFGTHIVGTEWDGARWSLHTEDGRTELADVVIAANGFLHRPVMPTLPGMDDFAGPSFHSSGWPKELDTTGKTVGIVGSGASGIQMVSALAYTDCEVVQFVRTPQWIETVDNPTATDEDRARVRAEPDQGAAALDRLVRRNNQDVRLQDPWWKLEKGAKREAASEALREDLLAIKDEELRRILTPSFAPGCKRIPKSPLYYQAVQEPNVAVVPHGVARVDAAGVTDADGQHHDLDVLVYATGFQTHSYVRPMTVVGAGGQTLDDLWAGGAFSYRGVGLPGFPNFFLLNGPFSPVNNVPVPKTLEDETGWVCRLIELVAERGVGISPTVEGTERFLEMIARETPRTVWAENCENWYTGPDGALLIWPWYDKEHEQMFDDLAGDDLEMIPLREVARESAGAFVE